MTYLNGLLHNRVLFAALMGWAVAQLIKTVLYTAMNRKFSPERLVGSGGMPSSHAATVCAMTTSTAIHYGTESVAFALAFVLSAVVLCDARGVRQETGKQAVTIGAIVEYLKEAGTIQLPDIKLKELVGHTPLQVAVGMVLGVLVGVLVR